MIPIRPRITPAQVRAFDLSIQPIIKQIAYFESLRVTQLVVHADGMLEITRGKLPDCIEETIVLLKSMIELARVEQFGDYFEESTRK